MKLPEIGPEQIRWARQYALFTFLVSLGSFFLIFGVAAWDVILSHILGW